MYCRLIFVTFIAVVLLGSSFVHAQQDAASQPAELAALKAMVGVWDAEFEVWSGGLDAPSMKFKGVETNRAFGQHWISSDLDCEVMGQTMKVHSIFGYDLSEKKIVGTNIDHGPYAASLTGEYDEKSKTINLVVNGKEPNGKPLVQRSSITLVNENERLLVVKVPAKNENKEQFIKLMQIKFVKRKPDPNDSK